MIKDTFQESIEVLNYLKKNNYECYVLSNWSAETFYGPEQTMIIDYPFLKNFDGLLIAGSLPSTFICEINDTTSRSEFSLYSAF